MLETSNDILLIASSIAILAFTGFLCHLVFNLTKIVQESKKTVEDVNRKLNEIDPMVKDLTTTVNGLTTTIQDINNNLLKPIASLSQVFKKVRSIVGAFKGE
ncbi:MAG: DUF948 domain-containing protein [Patescibacteria group bacterium]|nr:DUF948 domain-containing protein [Patescibacteria group bacterium]